MSLKFCANISWFYKSTKDLTKRYALAKQSGFTAVECAFPYDIPLDELANAKKAAGVEQVLINAYPGGDGELGVAALPGREEEFKSKLEMSIDYCKALDCRLLHVMAGKIAPGMQEATMMNTFVDNLKYAASRLSKEGIGCLIEPINTQVSAPGYFLDSLDKGAKVIKDVNHPNIQLQMDFFHVQIAHGHITHQIKQYLPITGHIQISQVPGRNEPDSPGELNYGYIFSLLKEHGYKGYIGLEYNPAGEVDDGLGWMEKLC